MITNNLSIAVNGSMLDDHPTGVGVYSFNLINSFSALSNTGVFKKMTVFAPAVSSLHHTVSFIKIPGILKSSQYGKIAAFSRFVWNTFVYPYQVRKYDLIISPTTHGSFFSPNQIIAVHDLISLKFNNISSHQRFYFKYLLPLMISKSKLVLTVSENSKADIIELLKCDETKIKIVHNGFDSNTFFFNGVNGAKIKEAYGVSNYLLAVGATYPHKNFELMIDAYLQLDEKTKRRHPLLIAGGKKKYLDVLKNYVAASGGTNIIFTGYVPDYLMQPLYNEASALIFPSLYEGFGIPLLEAMACGCPVISSNASSMPEVCGNAALYFHPSDKSALTLLITQLLKSETLQNELRQKGLQQAEKFSWSQSAKSLQTIIENIYSKN